MFVRKKKNRSGSVSVVVISKARGEFKEVKTVGVSSDADEVEQFYRQAQAWIRKQSGLSDMFEQYSEEEFERDAVDYFFDNIENVLLNGTQIILNQIFKIIGFDRIDDDILKSLVTARICQPLSKVATVDYLKSHFDEDVQLYQLYEYLDTLNVEVKINYDKIKEDEKWDGLKGYITNTRLTAEMVYSEYSGLWQVERAFRITKGTLELRPMFHFTQKRIKAHICICFVAYKVYKELERILKTNNINLSVDKVLDIAKTITTIRLRLPETSKIIERTMLLTDRHKLIASLFDKDFWKNNCLRIE